MTCVIWGWTKFQKSALGIDLITFQKSGKSWNYIVALQLCIIMKNAARKRKCANHLIITKALVFSRRLVFAKLIHAKANSKEDIDSFPEIFFCLLTNHPTPYLPSPVIFIITRSLSFLCWHIIVKYYFAVLLPSIFKPAAFLYIFIISTMIVFIKMPFRRFLYFGSSRITYL